MDVGVDKEHACKSKEIMKLTAIILTLNEARHLARCLESVKSVGASALIVDSFSTDDTLRIAESYGARVVQHPFVNHALQFNWALSQLETTVEWVLRIDADEYLTPELVSEIRDQLPTLSQKICGVYFSRRMTFQGRLIRYGGIFPIRVMRLFRNGFGECENRWMDEHIKVVGKTVHFQGEIIDDNLNSLSLWIDKHNRYASREAVELLNLKYRFMPNDSGASLGIASQAGAKRWIKEMIYARLPGGFRAFFYFFYRYVVRFGFLDGSAGTAFHFLQGFWYRYLVDAKIAEVKRYLIENHCEPREAIDRVLGIKLG
jgi:glycosyltransferase involved in cell wall biosynthesis